MVFFWEKYLRQKCLRFNVCHSAAEWRVSFLSLVGILTYALNRLRGEADLASTFSY